MSIRSRSMKTSVLALLAACTLFLTAATAQAQSKPKPMAVVAINDINSLFQDVDFIAGLGGLPPISGQYQPMVSGFTPGLDQSRPIGLIVQSQNDIPSGALCLPVTNLTQLLAVLQNFGVTSTEGPNGTLQIGVQGQTVFAKEDNGWAYVSISPDMLESLPANPGKLFAELTEEYDLGIRAHLQNIPEAYKQLMLTQLEAGFEAGMQQGDDETDEEFQARKEVSEFQIQQIKQLIQDLDEFTFGLSVDGNNRSAFMDFLVTAAPGSKLASQMGIYRDSKTDFAGFVQPDAAMMMSFAYSVPESAIAEAEQGLAASMQQLDALLNQASDDLDEADRELLKSAIKDFVEAVISSAKAGKVDGGAVVNASPNSLSMVAGGFVGEPAHVESGLKKLAELAKKKAPAFPGVNWNASSYQDLKFHTLSIPIPPNEADAEQARQLLGDSIEIAAGIGNQKAFLAMGRDCVGAIKSVVDASAASPQKSIPPVKISFALRPILETVGAFVDGDEKQVVALIADSLDSGAKDRDHVTLVMKVIPNGAGYRLEFEEGVLKAIGAGVMANQLQGAGAGGF